MSAEELRAYAKKLAQTAPPLSPETKDRLAVLLGGDHR